MCITVIEATDQKVLNAFVCGALFMSLEGDAGVEQGGDPAYTGPLSLTRQMVTTQRGRSQIKGWCSSTAEQYSKLLTQHTTR